EPLLRRLPGPAQSGQGRGGRWSGPRYVPHGVAPRHCLVVDDVWTTGATLAAAAAALRSAGATVVDAVTISARP
ncbi:MAG: phosphoribosyltransferase family protein, partial [Actinomycetes bacterium]